MTTPATRDALLSLLLRAETALRDTPYCCSYDTCRATIERRQLARDVQHVWAGEAAAAEAIPTPTTNAAWEAATPAERERLEMPMDGPWCKQCDGDFPWCTKCHGEASR